MGESPSDAGTATAGTDGSPSSDVAVVFLSHTLADSVLDRYRALERAAGPRDVYFAYDATDATSADRRRHRSVAGDRALTYERPSVLAADYEGPWARRGQRELVPGNLDLLYLHLGRTLPRYDRYWFVEYDVAYTGNWAEFLRTFEDASADVLGTTLRSHASNPDWLWWPSLRPVPDLDPSEWRCGFFPVVRLSRTALDHLDEAYRAGWSGHFEAVLPTLAHHRGLELEDVGGDGPYVADENRNRFYANTPARPKLSPGTFVYRPARSRPGVRSGTLYHPVKPDQRPLVPAARLAVQWVAHRLSGR